MLSIDSTSIKAHGVAPAEKGGGKQSAARAEAARQRSIAEHPLCRPVVLHLTPGQDADVAAAPDVLALAPPMSALLADKEYDGDNLRGEIVRCGAKPVSPTNPTASSFIASTNAPTKVEMSSSAAFAGSKTSAASPPVTTSSPGISWPLFISPLSSHIGSIEFGPEKLLQVADRAADPPMPQTPPHGSDVPVDGWKRFKSA
ncbi:hypothetical protein ABIB00_006382 [Bradyrhizobium sp. LB14.3]